MRIARLASPERFEIVDQPAPRRAPTDVLLDIVACGVCSSELAGWSGTSEVASPWWPGHEVSGVVREGDDGGTWRVGDRVAVWVTERGFAEQAAVAADRCFAADGVPLELALGEPLSCAVNAVELAGVPFGVDVVVIGAGFMGSLVQMLVALRGPGRLIAVDVRPDALELASKLGADVVIEATRPDATEEILEALGGTGADVTFEVTGSQGGLDLAGNVTRMSGTIAVVGYHQGGRRTIDLERWNWMAFRIANAHFRDLPTILRGMDGGMRLVTSGQISLEPLVTDRFELERIDEAFAMTRDKPEGFVKGVVLP